MKKILLVSNMYPSNKHPHYGIFVKHCRDILSSTGNIVIVLALKQYKNKIFKLFAYAIFYIKVVLYGIFGQFDVIYAHYASHTALPLQIVNHINKKCPIVTNVHGNDIVPDCAADTKNRKRSFKILKKSMKVVCPSEYFARVLINYYDVDPKKICIYPSGGVNVKIFRRIEKEKALKKLNLNPNYRYIGYVGRIEEKKGWDIFLKACEPIVRECSNIQLIVVGDGSQREDYYSLVKKMELENRIIYRPLLKQTELVYIYNALDLFVFPTFRESESLGLVGLEAMACECVVLTSDKYGPASYIRDGINGFQFLTGNYLDARKQIKKIMFNVENLEKIKAEARKTAIHYSNDETDHILINLFSDINR